MSIVVNLYYTGTGGAARAFAREMTDLGIAADIRAEDGNERYEYFFPMDDPETVCSSTAGATRPPSTRTTARR